MKDAAKQTQLSIKLSTITWIIFSAMLIVPISKGGLTTISGLILLAAVSSFIAIDIRATLSFRAPKTGWLSVLYFTGWSFVIIHSGATILFSPFIFRDEAEIGPGGTNLTLPLISIILIIFAVWKFKIGRALRRHGAKQLQLDAEQCSSEPLTF